MTAPSTDSIGALRRTIYAALALFMLGLSFVVWLSWWARQQNCTQVERAFDAYTTALAAETDADPKVVQHFRDSYEPELRACS